MNDLVSVLEKADLVTAHNGDSDGSDYSIDEEFAADEPAPPTEGLSPLQRYAAELPYYDYDISEGAFTEQPTAFHFAYRQKVVPVF